MTGWLIFAAVVALSWWLRPRWRVDFSGIHTSGFYGVMQFRGVAEIVVLFGPFVWRRYYEPSRSGYGYFWHRADNGRSAWILPESLLNREARATENLGRKARS